MSTRFGVGPVLLVGIIILFVPFAHGDTVLAQAGETSLRRQVVVGNLVGRVDFRELRLLTRQGSIRLVGEGNGKPFSIGLRNKNQVTVRYHEFGLQDFNPNTVTIKLFESERALMSALILEEVDVAVLESEASAIEIRKSNNHFLPLPIPMEPNNVKLVIYNNRNPLFASSRIRRAISLGIDHGYVINKIIRGGKATLAKGPFDENSARFNSGMKSYKNNPRLALKTLANMGWRDSNRDGVIEKNGRPFVFELLYKKGLRLDEAISRIIKINLIKLGIDVQPRPLTKAELNDRLASGDFQAALTDHVFEDGVESLRAFFSTSGKENHAGYRSATFERYLDFYDSASDRKRKKTLVKSLQSVLNEDQPATFLYFKWNTHYIVNVRRFANYRHLSGPKSGKIRPFEEWIVKPVLDDAK